MEGSEKGRKDQQGFLPANASSYNGDQSVCRTTVLMSAWLATLSLSHLYRKPDYHEEVAP